MCLVLTIQNWAQMILSNIGLIQEISGQVKYSDADALSCNAVSVADDIVMPWTVL